MSKTSKATHVFSFNYKRSFYFLFILLTLMSVLSLLVLKQVTVQEAAQLSHKTEKVSLLFIQTAKTATIAQVMDDDEEVYTLSLSGISPEIQFFSDTPRRITGSIKESELLNTWVQNDDAFRSDPPNAEMSITTPTGLQHFTLLLTHPVYDEKASTVRYEIAPLQNQILTTGTYSNVTLLINNVDTHAEKMFKLEATDGHEALLTAQHPVLTPHGLVTAEQLHVGDAIISHLGQTTVKTLDPAEDRPALFDLKTVTAQNPVVANPAQQTFFANGISVGDSTIFPVR